MKKVLYSDELSAASSFAASGPILQLQRDKKGYLTNEKGKSKRDRTQIKKESIQCFNRTLILKNRWDFTSIWSIGRLFISIRFYPQAIHRVK